MKNNKVLKGIGLLSLGLVAVNGVIGALGYKKAKDLHKNYDIAVTFGEETIDMCGKGNQLNCGTMFASTTLDFRNCLVTSEPIEIDLFAQFASVEIVVPEGWYVESKGKITMAGIENFTATYEDEVPSIILRFNASFAGLRVVNVKYS